MKMDYLYLGTWFQRTSLHLREVYDFLHARKGVVGLDQDKLDAHWRSLDVGNVRLHRETDIDYVKTECAGITVTLSEDGVLLLSLPGGGMKERRHLEMFYSEKLGPALAYLFSRGAPLPKELTTVKTVYPIIALVHEATAEDVEVFFAAHGDQQLTAARTDSIDIVFGQVVEMISVTRVVADSLAASLVPYLIFFREIENQLQRYLDLHRQLWDEVAHIRRSTTLRYQNFPDVRHLMLSFLETLSFVQARLAQIDDMLNARQRLVSPQIKATMRQLGVDRFENLHASQQYTQHLWRMTVDYVHGTMTLLESLFQENTQRELNAIKFMTVVAALTGFFGMNIAFPWEERWPDTFVSSFVVVGIIIAFITLVYLLFKFLIYNRRFWVHKK